jgi:hypothetical protein
VSELKAQVRRGCSGAQVWTPSPPIRPHFCPPLCPPLVRAAAADAVNWTGPTPATNWPSRCTRRTRKGGARRQACVAGHLRPEVRRFGEEKGARGPRGSDLLCSSRGVWSGVPRLPLRAGSAIHPSAPRPRHRGSAASPTRTVPSRLRAPGELGGVRLRSGGRGAQRGGFVGSGLGRRREPQTAVAARAHGADPLPDRSFTGRACLIVVGAFLVG